MANNWGGQPIPHNQEAEEAALGAALVNAAYAEEILTIAPPEKYFILRCKYVAQAIKRCLENSQPVDYLTVLNALTELGKLAEIGGPAYLTQLINSTPNSSSGKAYAGIVSRLSTRRDLLAAADQQKALALDEEKTIEQVIAAVEQNLNTIAESTSLDNVYEMREIMHLVLDNMETRIAEKHAGGNGLIGLPTGIGSLDELLSGFRPSKLYLVGGRAGMGKTSLLIFFGAVTANLPPKPDGSPHVVYFWSGEMDADEIGERALASQAGVDSNKILEGSLNAAETKAVWDAGGALGNKRLVVDTTVYMTPKRLRANIRKWQRANGLKVDMVIVDYAQLMHGDGKFGNSTEELTSISRALKELPRQLKIPLLAAVQVNRGTELRDDKRPQLSDLKGSGGFEQDADVVLFPFFEEYYANKEAASGYMEIIVAKQRGGRKGKVDVWADFARNHYNEDVMGAGIR